MATSDRHAVATARDYYNSEDADRFYATIWGGEDIHIGLYETPHDPIVEASQRTVQLMADRLPALGVEQRILDIGSGYGGAARTLARRFSCKVTGLNLSEVENERARRLNREQGLAQRIEIIDGNFEQMPLADASFDVVWSQDAILHSAARGQVLSEVARVLAAGGHFVFTDPMQADDCPPHVLDPILERIHLPNLASPDFYRRELSSLGFEERAFQRMTEQLVRHYTRVLEETERVSRLPLDHSGRQGISSAYLERMQRGLRHWITGGREEHLAWGIFHYQKIR